MTESDGEMEEAGPAEAGPAEAGPTEGGSDDAAMQDSRPFMPALRDWCFAEACRSRWRCDDCVRRYPTVQHFASHSTARSPDMCGRCNSAFQKKWQAEQKHAVLLWQMYDQNYHVAAINWVLFHVNSEFLPEEER